MIFLLKSGFVTEPYLDISDWPFHTKEHLQIYRELFAKLSLFDGDIFTFIGQKLDLVSFFMVDKK